MSNAGSILTLNADGTPPDLAHFLDARGALTLNRNSERLMFESRGRRLAEVRLRANASRQLARSAMAVEKRNRGASQRRERGRNAEERAQQGKDGGAAGEWAQDRAEAADLDAAAVRRDADEWRERRKTADEEMEQMGLRAPLERAIRAPATVAARQDHRAASVQKRKQKQASEFGWASYNPDTHYRVHKKRLASVGLGSGTGRASKRSRADDGSARPAGDSGETTNDVAADGKVAAAAASSSSSAISLNSNAIAVEDSLHDISSLPPKANVDRMVRELEGLVQRRKNYSRAKGTRGADNFVDFINDRNAQFNKKGARSFDKYTHEIKANLERGTAV